MYYIKIEIISVSYWKPISKAEAASIEEKEGPIMLSEAAGKYHH